LSEVQSTKAFEVIVNNDKWASDLCEVWSNKDW